MYEAKTMYRAVKTFKSGYNNINGEESREIVISIVISILKYSPSLICALSRRDYSLTNFHGEYHLLLT